MQGKHNPRSFVTVVAIAAASALFVVALTGCKKKDINMTTHPDQPEAASASTTVIVETSLGSITIELDADKAPETVANFLKYVDAKHYDGTIFHRVIPGFMIQGGGFDANMKEKSTGLSIKNESANGLLNVTGSIAMARTSDPHSATSQFFINVGDNSFLDKANAQDGWGYAVFGKVTEGLDVVKKIVAVKTGNVGPHGDVPVEAIVIKSARRSG